MKASVVTQAFSTEEAEEAKKSTVTVGHNAITKSTSAATFNVQPT